MLPLKDFGFKAPDERIAFRIFLRLRGVSGFYVAWWFGNIQRELFVPNLPLKQAAFSSLIRPRYDDLHLGATTYLVHRHRSLSVPMTAKLKALPVYDGQLCGINGIPLTSTKGWRDVTSGNSPRASTQVPFTSKSFFKCSQSFLHAWLRDILSKTCSPEF